MPDFTRENVRYCTQCGGKMRKDGKPRKRYKYGYDHRTGDVLMVQDYICENFRWLGSWRHDMETFAISPTPPTNPET